MCKIINNTRPRLCYNCPHGQSVSTEDDEDQIRSIGFHERHCSWAWYLSDRTRLSVISKEN